MNKLDEFNDICDELYDNDAELLLLDSYLYELFLMKSEE